MTEALVAANGEIICKSVEMQEVLKLARVVADTDSTVLISGESGTGKELVASTIHRSGRRAPGPLLCVNCGVLPEELLENELFGRERDVFYSEVPGKPGIFEMADRGTVFLDDVAELSPALQVKLLRVLETRTLQRTGETKAVEVNVRVIGATNRNLEKARREGLFREDLYYRLNVVEIRIPPLRERPSDIPALAETFLKNIAETSGVPAKSISADAMERIARFHWPGNVRELQNVIERSLIISKADEIQIGDLPDYVVNGMKPADPPPDKLKPLDEIESEYVRLAVNICGGNKSKAARLLGIDRGTLARKLRG